MPPPKNSLVFPYYANNSFLEVFSLTSKSGNHKSDHNLKEIAREFECAFLIPRNHFYLLYILCPVWRVTHGHKYTVGKNSAHNEHIE